MILRSKKQSPYLKNYLIGVQMFKNMDDIHVDLDLNTIFID